MTARLHRLLRWFASRLAPIDDAPEFAPEAFAVPRYAQPAPTVSIGALEHLKGERYGFRLYAPVALYASLSQLPSVDGLILDSGRTFVPRLYINRYYAIDAATAEATYTTLCAVIRAAAGERASQEDTP